MKFIARLIDKQGRMYPAEFRAESFSVAFERAKEVFPDYRVVTVYPKGTMNRLEWLAWNARMGASGDANTM